MTARPDTQSTAVHTEGWGIFSVLGFLATLAAAIHQLVHFHESTSGALHEILIPAAGLVLVATASVSVHRRRQGGLTGGTGTVLWLLLGAIGGLSLACVVAFLVFLGYVIPHVGVLLLPLIVVLVLACVSPLMRVLDSGKGPSG